VITDDLLLVVRSNSADEVLARATNLLIARGAYHAAARLGGLIAAGGVSMVYSLAIRPKRVDDHHHRQRPY
jgi:hypothetical protein